jgi:m7GpppX diphosphatase
MLNSDPQYSKQPSIVIRETRELYTQVVKPYIDSFPSSRIQWSVPLALPPHTNHHLVTRVYNILSHKTESSKILHEDPSPLTGYIILPDLKWDGKSLNSLYLIAIAHSKDLRSLRDLRGGHLDMLKSIRREALRVVREKWGLDGGKLRFFVHYQPSYCTET